MSAQSGGGYPHIPKKPQGDAQVEGDLGTALNVWHSSIQVEGDLYESSNATRNQLCRLFGRLGSMSTIFR